MLSSGLASASVPDSIPNSDFEQWSTTGWYDFPTGWMTNNNQLLAATVVKDSLAHSGNLAMRLTNLGGLRPEAWCGFHLSSHPLNLGGYVRSLLFNNDSGEIHVRLYFNQQLVDSGYSVVYNGIFPLFNTFIVPISQNSVSADSCVISFDGGTVYQSDILYDDLQLDFLLAIPAIKNSQLMCFPNPCSDRAILHFNAGNFYPDEIFAINTLGEKHPLNFIADMNKEDYIYYMPHDGKFVLDVGMLSKGIWIIAIKNKSETYITKLIKN